ASATPLFLPLCFAPLAYPLASPPFPTRRSSDLLPLCLLPVQHPHQCQRHILSSRPRWLFRPAYVRVNSVPESWIVLGSRLLFQLNQHYRCVSSLIQKV